MQADILISEKLAKRVREILGHDSLRAASTKSGLSRDTVSRLRSAVGSTTTLNSLIKFSESYNVPLDELLALTDITNYLSTSKPTEGLSNLYNLLDSEVTLAWKNRILSPRQRREILVIVENYLRNQ